MRLDPFVLRRLEELIDKAKKVEATREKTEYTLEAVNSEEFEEWATSVLSLLQRVFGQGSVHYSNFHTHYAEFKGWAKEFERCRGILKAAKEDYEGGYIFRVRSLIGAELLSDALDQAAALLKDNYKDPACVVARVALETTLKELCSRNSIPHAKFERMNADLRKAGVYNLAMQKQITAWADRGNNAAHGNWGEYTPGDVEDMVKGINRFVADYLR